MTRIIMVGCGGKMGKTISDIVRSDSEAQIVAGVRAHTSWENDYPVYPFIKDVKEEADVINEQLDREYEYVYDRSIRREKRPVKEIGFSAVRGGTIVGEHEIIFAGTDEVIEFKHKTYSKAIFGKGAEQAAKFLKGKPAGLYGMREVIN